ncbi:MAG: hypothetical protein QY325_08510 [Flavobacteriales bacterium]|nr:MAG: hypothetical protein QY325_08510 [Flavobacteriales bacterium]
MRSEFIKPKFKGERFDQHSLPLDVASDLAAYQNLVIELAKRLYLKDHPERQRTPKGFSNAFELHVERVEEGSAIVPLIALTAALTSEPNAQQYFDRARELVTECIAAPLDQLPEEFPEDLLSYFNQVGSSLREGESLELPRKGGGEAVLTPKRRKDMVLARSKVYERPVELAGYIGEIDWERKTFRLRLTDNSSAIVPLATSFEQKARQYGGTSRHMVVVKCVASFDSYERLQSVDHVEACSLQLNHELAGKLEALSVLQNGWYDGLGKAPDAKALSELSRMLVRHYPAHLKLPAVVPTQDGNLLLEWNGHGEPAVDVDLSTMHAAFQRFAPDGTDIEAAFTLRTDEDWKKFMAFLNDHIPASE